MALYIFIAAAVGYLLGSIPFGILVARMMGLGNLRKLGSGNIGATNVLRTGNKLAAALTLLADGGKGLIAVVLVRIYFSGTVADDSPLLAVDDTALLAVTAGVFAVIGHCFPVWLGFRGGKGVATGIGVVLALSFYAGAIMCAVWLLVAAIGRRSSLASLTAYAAAPIALFILADDGGNENLTYAMGSFAIAMLSWWQHRGNIARLLKGTEPKIGA